MKLLEKAFRSLRAYFALRTVFLVNLTLWPRIFPLIRSKAPVLVEKNRFVTIVRRPVSLQQGKPRGMKGGSSFPDTAIVLQGPLMKRYSFTLETVRAYSQYFPESSIYVSCWNDEAKRDLDELGEAGAIVVASARENQTPGPYNVRWQAVTSHAGVSHAVADGCKFLLKTRTDQRFYSPLAIGLLRDLWERFPLEASQDSQEGRLVFGSSNSFINRNYGLSDFFVFGASVDVSSFYGEAVERLATISDHEFLRQYVYPETFFFAQHLENQGFPLAWSTDDYLAWVRRLAIIVDTSSLDLFWPKYSPLEYRWRKYTSKHDKEELSFALWLSLVNSAQDTPT